MLLLLLLRCYCPLWLFFFVSVLLFFSLFGRVCRYPPMLRYRYSCIDGGGRRDLILQMILGAAHALRGGATVHVVHHRAATVVHGLLANSHLTNAVADLMTLGYWAFLQLA